METQLTGTVIDGTLKLDRPLDLPNNSRVSVTIEPITGPSADTPTDAARREAWERFMQRIQERPVNSGGRHFTRDELHERR